MKWIATDLGLVTESPPVMLIVLVASEYALVLPAPLNPRVPPFGMLLAVLKLFCGLAVLYPNFLPRSSLFELVSLPDPTRRSGRASWGFCLIHIRP